MKVKSFNTGPGHDAIVAIAIFVTLAVLVAFALPQGFQHGIIPALQHANQAAGPFSGKIDLPGVSSEWGLLTGMVDAMSDATYGRGFTVLVVICLTGSVALAAYSFASARRAVHDGTWLGPERVDGDPGGTAYLVSKHSDLRRLLTPWSGKSTSKRSGLPVAYFDRKFWMLPYINLLVYGAPGSGKTRRVLIPAVCAHIAAGDSVLCLDPKNEIGDYTEDFAKSHGYRVVRVMIGDPLHSPDTINPLDAAIEFAQAGQMDDAVAEVGGIAKVICPTKSKSNPHFDDSARTLCEGLLLAVVIDPEIPPEQKNFSTISAIVSFAGADGTTGLERIRKMAQSLPNAHPAKGKLSQVANTGDEEASSIISTFTNKLNDYCDARVSKMLWRSTFKVEDMAHEKTIVFLSFTSANGNYGKLVTTLVTNAISALRREAARQGGHLGRECYLLLEEMAQMERIETIYSDAGIMRGEGVHLLLVLQVKSQLLTKYSRDEAASLTGCCDDTLVLSVNELDVAKELSSKCGTYPALMQTSNQSHGSNGSSYFGSSSNGSTKSSQKRDLITPDEMLRWGPSVGNLLIGHGGVFALPSPELSKTFVNELLGLGDQKFNDELRAKKKAERPVRNSEPAPIWLPELGSESGENEAGEPSKAVHSRRGYNPLRV